MPPLCIYLVDDRVEHLRRDFRTALPRPQVDLVLEHDPVQALEDFTFLAGRLANRSVDAVLLDVNFHSSGNRPAIRRTFGVDPTSEQLQVLGVALLERFRQIDPDIPIGMITAYPRLDTAHAAGQSRANFYYPKPRDNNWTSWGTGLLSRIKNAVRRRRSTFDRDQRRLADRVAGQYVALETSKPGTSAYWRFEEDLLLNVTQYLAPRGRVRILDVGCGEGRYERKILNQHRRGFTVDGLDFSGKMLELCRRQSLVDVRQGRLCLRRGIAEKLPYPNQSFDLVVLGFGFPCYSDCARVLDESVRVLKQSGTLFVSIYNYDALFYDAWTSDRLNDPTIPIAGKIDRDRGVLRFGGGRITVRPYTMPEFGRHLLRRGLHIAPTTTFPTLLSTLPTSLTALPRTGPSGQALYEQDKFISRAMRNRGYYGVFLASPSKSAITRLARTISLA